MRTPPRSSHRPRYKVARNLSGNPLNRVYDSTGPEGKVRGTPQQIMDKYEAFSQDAATMGDHVAAENFLQHAEHYARILTGVRRMQDKRRDERRLEADRDLSDSRPMGRRPYRENGRERSLEPVRDREAIGRAPRGRRGAAQHDALSVRGNGRDTEI